MILPVKSSPFSAVSFFSHLDFLTIVEALVLSFLVSFLIRTVKWRYKSKNTFADRFWWFGRWFVSFLWCLLWCFWRLLVLLCAFVRLTVQETRLFLLWSFAQSSIFDLLNPIETCRNRAHIWGWLGLFFYSFSIRPLLSDIGRNNVTFLPTKFYTSVLIGPFGVELIGLNSSPNCSLFSLFV